MEATYASTQRSDVAVQIVMCFDQNVLTPEAQRLDQETGGLLTHGIKARRFKGALGKTLMVTHQKEGALEHIILLGLGKKEDMTRHSLERAGAALHGPLSSLEGSWAQIHGGDMHFDGLDGAVVGPYLVHGYHLRSTPAATWKSEKKEDSEPNQFNMHVVTTASGCEAVHQELVAQAEGVFFTRDLVNAPPNILYPETLKNELQALESLGVKVEVLDEAQMKKLGMGSLLGVAQGSEKKPYCVIMRWMGTDAKDTPLAVIGKGVTFDSGGLNLKPSGFMEDMKYDMGGAGVVAGIMKTLALRKAKANVLGAVALVENMPSHMAQRPSDVVTSMSGKTIEILNTDAEGRLILCDIMWYVQENYKPKEMVDFATLTGAMVISLGDQYAGIFSNDDALASGLITSGDTVQDRLWRMPLHKDYDKALDSSIADVQNISLGRKAGSITAAQFLQRFVQKGVAWAHIDIAGVANADKPIYLCPKGGTGFGVRLVDEYVKKTYEGK